jgi:hypothetical protein
VFAILPKKRDVGNDQVNAQQFRFWKHHPGIDYDDVFTEAEHHHIHPEFAKAPEWYRGECLRRLAQGISFSDF